MSTINTMAKGIGKFVEKNAPTILTWVGIGCFTGASAYSVYNTFKAANKIEREEVKREENCEHALTNGEKFKLVWKSYIPAVLLIGAGGAAVVTANHINLLRIEALATAYAASNGKVKELKEKLEKEMGIEKPVKGLHDHPVDKNRTNDSVEDPDTPPWDLPDTNFRRPRGQRVRVKDTITGRYFVSSIDDIEKAVNEFNKFAIAEGHGHMNDFYDFLGIDNSDIGNMLQFDVEKKGDTLEMQYDWETGPDDGPMLTITSKGWTIDPYFDEFEVGNM